MILKKLQLENFRSYRQKTLDFNNQTTLIIGNNGTGKTNLLEAIFLLATGKSFRAERDEQMVYYDQAFSRASGLINEQNLSVFISRPKRLFINYVAKRKMDFIGAWRCVLFRPEDIDLVLGSPSLRRNYLDFVLEQADREYRRCNLSYQKGLRQRNRLLERIRNGEAQRPQLLFWNELLIKNGEIVSRKREEFIDFVNGQLGGQNARLTLKYEPSRIALSRLEQYAANEVAAAKTLVGPHRDEFRFIYQREGKLEKDLSLYGSRGEQRMAILGVKLAELKFMDRAVLLLDDIFSELDQGHRLEVIKLINQQQTIITTSDAEMLPKKINRKIEKISIK